MKKAFTMIELVFAIVIIGILASVAIPKLAVTRDDAMIVKGRTTVAALRMAISTQRQKLVLSGTFDAISGADAVALLDYGLDTDWAVTGDRFVFTGPSGNTCSFDLNNSKLLKNTGSCAVAGFSDL